VSVRANTVIDPSVRGCYHPYGKIAAFGWLPDVRLRSEARMYTLIRSITIRSLVVEQAPALGASLLIAELFYKFHSFALEAMAFLATWFVADGIVSFMRRMLQR